MTAPDKIKQLVQTFEQNLNEYHTRKNETELRRQFLDPFFGESVQRQVESTDGGIDKLVYELYGLSEEEIGIVEGK